MLFSAILIITEWGGPFPSGMGCVLDVVRGYLYPTHWTLSVSNGMDNINKSKLYYGANRRRRGREKKKKEIVTTIAYVLTTMLD